jgi:hypothetical protein
LGDTFRGLPPDLLRKQIIPLVLSALQLLAQAPDIRRPALQERFLSTLKLLLPDGEKTDVQTAVEAIFAAIHRARPSEEVRRLTLERAGPLISRPPEQRLEERLQGLSDGDKVTLLSKLLARLILEREFFNHARRETVWSLQIAERQKMFFHRHPPTHYDPILNVYETSFPIPETMTPEEISPLLHLISKMSELSEVAMAGIDKSPKKIATRLKECRDLLEKLLTGASTPELVTLFDQIKKYQATEFLYHYYTTYGLNPLTEFYLVLPKELKKVFEPLTPYWSCANDVFVDRRILGANRVNCGSTRGLSPVEVFKDEIQEPLVRELVATNLFYTQTYTHQDRLYRAGHTMLWELTADPSQRISRCRTSLKGDIELLPSALPPLARRPATLEESFNDWCQTQLAAANSPTDRSEFLPPELVRAEKKRLEQAAQAKKKQPPSRTSVAEVRGESSSASAPPLPGTPAAFRYASRVVRWFQSGQLTKPHDCFAEYDGLSQEEFQRKVQYHGFSLMVDRFLHLGIEETWPNRTTGHPDRQVLIPAQIGQSRGTIIYCFGEDKVCYHRYFKPMTTKEMVEKFGFHTFKEADFPELRRAQTAGPTVAQKDLLKDRESDFVEYDEAKGLVTIVDRRFDDLPVKLFRIRV